MSRVRIALASCTFAIVVFAAAIVYANTSLDQVFAQLEQQYGLPQGLLAKVAWVESANNPTAGHPSRAYGMFQWFAVYWQSATKALYGQYLDPAKRADPVEAAKVTAFSLAQAKSYNGSLIQQAKVDMILGLYLNHFLGQAGARTFLQAYMSNPNQDASALLPKAAANNKPVFGGRTVAGVLNYIAGKLKVAPVATGVQGNFTDPAGNSLAYSSANLSPNNFSQTPYVPMNQPDPYRDYPTTFQPSPQAALFNPQTLGSGLDPTAYQTQLQQTNTPSNSSDNSQTNSSGTSSGSTALILVQPATALRGGGALVTWTSSGMRSNSCTVSMNGKNLWSGNEDSRRVAVSKTSKTGTARFTLTCTANGGGTVTRSANLVIQ